EQRVDVPDAYDFEVQAYVDDLEGATTIPIDRPAMTISFLVAGEYFVLTEIWTRVSSGWQLNLGFGASPDKIVFRDGPDLFEFHVILAPGPGFDPSSPPFGISLGGSEGASPAISADGRFVAFLSSSPDLVTGDTNNATDVYVHDRLAARTTRVSV